MGLQFHSAKCKVGCAPEVMKTCTFWEWENTRFCFTIVQFLKLEEILKQSIYIYIYVCVKSHCHHHHHHHQQHLQKRWREFKQFFQSLQLVLDPDSWCNDFFRLKRCPLSFNTITPMPPHLHANSESKFHDFKFASIVLYGASSLMEFEEVWAWC